jgi:hypothetical protein
MAQLPDESPPVSAGAIREERELSADIRRLEEARRKGR